MVSNAIRILIGAVLAVSLAGSVYAEKQGAGEKQGKKAQAGKETRPNMPPERGGHGGGPFSIEGLTHRLDLNEAQKARMKVILTDYQKEQILSEAKGRVGEIELEQLLDETNPDATKIEAKVREIGAIQAESRIMRIKKLLETKSFLSAEQFSRLKNIVSRMMGGPSGQQGGMEGGPGMRQGDRPSQGPPGMGQQGGQRRRPQGQRGNDDEGEEE